MKSEILGFHQDDLGDWVAELACGHHQHMRHDPPWRTRPWVLTAEGLREKTGARLECPKCRTKEPEDKSRKTRGNKGSSAGG